MCAGILFFHCSQVGRYVRGGSRIKFTCHMYRGTLEVVLGTGGYGQPRCICVLYVGTYLPSAMFVAILFISPSNVKQPV